MNENITCNIIRPIAVLSTGSKGWQLELNEVSWNGAKPKLDIHRWNENHDRCSRCSSFTKEEATLLLEALKKELEG